MTAALRKIAANIGKISFAACHRRWRYDRHEAKGQRPDRRHQQEGIRVGQRQRLPMLRLDPVLFEQLSST
jgi:hypothetical protein